MRAHILLITIALLGCRSGDGATSEVPDEVIDRDGDGFAADVDCDDLRATVNPDATELPYDGIDNDCNATTRDDDLDNDGFVRLEDCNDNDPAVSPNGREVCNSIDDDCNQIIDDGVGELWYADVDRDGFGDNATTTVSCAPGAGWTADNTDCDDTDDDVRPGAIELCDSKDNDCDGNVDLNTADGNAYYADVDGDGYGNPDALLVACSLPAGHSPLAGDCDDSDGAAAPNLAEVCDDKDNNCDGNVDEVAIVWFADVDNDGFGNPSFSTTSCTQPPGYVANQDDCNDGSAAIHPDADELCADAVDNNCDGQVNEPDAIDAANFYVDVDGDGFGGSTVAAVGCVMPPGTVDNNSDCDDIASWVNPDAPEWCNGIDENCNDQVDEGQALGATRYHADVDTDGYGDPDAAVDACEAPVGFVEDGTDCDDDDAARNPGMTEVCDGSDNDCDLDVDDADSTLDTTTWLTFYADLDGDGFGAPSATQQRCSAPLGYVGNDDDCDDSSLLINPDAQEWCDNIDQNCDGDNNAGAEGLAQACSATSCAQILSVNPDVDSGFFWVDLDGVPSIATCDMTTDGGGWTQIYAQDFEAGPDPAWSISGTSTCAGWGTEILGGPGVLAAGPTSGTFSTRDVPHSEVRTTLDVLSIDSWDWEAGYVDVDGVRGWTEWFSWHLGPSNSCGDTFNDHRTPVSITQPHAATTVELTIGSALNEATTNESLGIDDVSIWVR